VLRNYEPNAHNATEYNLTSTDLQTATIDFHWIDGGKKGVQVSAQVAGVALTASVTFNVLPPTDVSMTSKTGGVYVGHGDNADAIQLYLGSGERGVDGVIEPGIQFNFKATAPPNGKGKIAGFQLVTISRSLTLNNGSILFNTHTSWSLNTTFPYGSVTNPIDADDSATWHHTNKHAREEYPMSDSPGIILEEAWSYFDIDDHYQTWFMYKHIDKDSIWVPLGVLEWSWEASTSRNQGHGNSWRVPIIGHVPKDPSGALTTALPLWSQNAADFHGTYLLLLCYKETI